ncbi:MAG: acyl-CoA synthetase [Alphaproteobacteria bacterium]|nr:acyl-CoA synthetase [Alphaproteobacteria bacterium]MBL6938389.1 acyl-CoA synthetase [Alphaproteobacteria bacterium]MBL7096448.1 acyl-CoA synthetase [Alphaproteobacteria bacterium]
MRELTEQLPPTQTGFNFGDIVDAVSAIVPPEAPAFVHGDRVIKWRDATRRMNNIARNLHARGVKPGDKVAFYMRNGIEYGELTGACFLGRLTHVNVNYRYKPEEVRYIVDNSDATVVCYAREFRDAVAQIHNQLDKVKVFVEVGGEQPASFATAYEKLATTGNGAKLGIERSPHDQVMVYTGGTTGMPKGVMYAQGDLSTTLLARIFIATGKLPDTVEDVVNFVKAAGDMNPVYLPACPQMHGTGFFGTMSTIMTGGCVVTVDNAHLDADAIWAAVEKNRVTNMAIVGDPFGRPLLKVLDENPGKYDISSVIGIGSSGAMWSKEVKHGLLEHLPAGTTLTDSFSSTEALGMGVSVAQKGVDVPTAAFMQGPNAIVIDDEDQPIEAGSGRTGRLAVGGVLPVGYYKDEEKTNRLFRIINGKRFSVPGDYAIVEADGRIILLGRGSNCINTAGEKVFPEEVEEVLKKHAAVEDALVLGVPDEQWGSAVTGVVKLHPGANFDEASIRAHVREHLAGYKTPKRVLIAGVNLRAPNGKADYKSATEFARRELGIA